MEKGVVTHFASGMLTVPQELQRSLGLAEGSEVLLRVENGELIAHPVARPSTDIDEAFALIETFRGMFAGSGSISDELLKIRAEEEEFERRKWSL